MVRIERIAPENVDVGFALLKSLSNGHCLDLGTMQEGAAYPNTAILFAVKTDRLAGTLIAGTFFVRGMIADFSVAEEHKHNGVARELVSSALRHMSERGIHRVHVLLPEAKREKIDFFSTLGFKAQPGEKTMVREQSTPARPADDEALGVRPMTMDDIPEALKLLDSEPEVARCTWENERLLVQSLQKPNASLYVSRIGGRLAGALLGGSYLTYGSICHLVVAKEFRGRNIGMALALRAVSDFDARGVKRSHLFVTGNNHGVMGFWRKVGYEEVTDLVTLEQDLPVSAP